MNTAFPETTAPTQERTISRAEKRKNERLQAEVNQMYNALTAQFLTLFTTSTDPEGQLIQNKAKQAAAQWRTYCKAKHLIPTLYTAMDNYIDALMKDYITMKEGNKKASEKIITDPPGVVESPGS